MQPWHFFILAALACATALTFLVRGSGITAVVLLTLLMGATALVGIAALRTFRPLTGSQDDRVLMIGQRTRAALERDKILVLKAIKELEFDRAMGKLSDDDFWEMSGRLRRRATRLMQQLDAGAGYRQQVERELASRLGTRSPQDPAASAGKSRPPDAPATARGCASCSTVNDPDARFCKECGSKL